MAGKLLHVREQTAGRDDVLGARGPTLEMSDEQKFKRLRDYLDSHPGAPLDVSQVGRLLSLCWHDLDGSTDTNMRAEKLWRIEQPSWNPPILEFSIERHGQTVNGSSRATVYRWSVNLEKGEAYIIGEKRRQLYSMDRCLDVKPIAQSVAAFPHRVLARRTLFPVRALAYRRSLRPSLEFRRLRQTRAKADRLARLQR